MESVARPLVASGLFFAVARGYTESSGVEVPVSTQLVVASVLGASTYLSEFSESSNPASRALLAGTLFAGGMLALGSSRVLTHAVLGTLAAYGAEVVVPEQEVPEEE
jgi:hypothetical protein